MAILSRSRPTAEVEDATTSQAAVNCYLSTVVTVAECLVTICPELGTSYRERLMRVPRRLGFDATPEALDESRTALRTDLHEFADIAGEYLHEIPSKAIEIAALVLQTSEVLSARADTFNQMIETLVEQMETAAELDDPQQFRRMIGQQAGGLRASSVHTRDEVSALLRNVSQQAREFQRKLQNPESLMTTDEATGLLNRRGMLRQLRNYCESDQQFCVLLFKIDTLAGMAPEEMEPMAKKVATRLVDQIRPADIASRWAANRFLVIFQCNPLDAESRLRQIAAGMSDSYLIRVGDQEVRRAAQVSVAIMEPGPSRSLDELMEEIDRVC